MEASFIALVAYISFCIFTFANCVKIQTVSFRVRRKHREIRKCSMEIMNNQTAVSGRISDLTGKCEHLGIGLNEQEILEPGYGYIEKVTYEQIFQKEEKLEERVRAISIDFPRLITIGSRLDFTFLRTPPTSYEFWLDQGQAESPMEHRMKLWVEEATFKPEILVDYDPAKRKRIGFDWTCLCPLNQCKMSVLVFDGYVHLLANNQMISDGIVESALTELKQIGRATFVVNDAIEYYVKLDRFKVTK